MASVSHYIEYAIVRLGVALARPLSDRNADRFGAGLGSIAYLVLGSRRRIAAENLRRAMGVVLPEAEIHRVAREVFRNMGRTMIEFARFPRMGLPRLREIVVSDSSHVITDTLKAGRGGIFLTAHFGNWEMLGAWVHALGPQMNLLVATQHNQMVDAAIDQFRRSMDVNIIRIPGELRAVFKALRANEYIGIAADQHAPGSELIIDFFGRPAAMAKGPALFAIRAGCPIVPFVLVRERHDRHVAIAGPIIYPPTGKDEEASIREMTVAYARFFEEKIREHPAQWAWAHRRWKVRADYGA